MERRRMMAWALGGIGLLPLVAAGFPSVAYLLQSGKKREQEAENSWRNLGKTEEFPVGEMREIEIATAERDWSKALNLRSVYVWRQSAEQFIVFSRSCTDLGCPVVWDAGSQWFFCPCHGGVFAKDGEPKAGPPKVPLYRYANRIQDGVLQIDAHSVPPMI
ncbi:MAG: ubiquinol-cytochrome c reductase iron-sulfur subunit [Oligoflexus sp.]